MKTTIRIPVFAAIAAVILAIGTTAFKTEIKKEKPFNTTMYYHGASFSQSDVQTIGNWNTTSQTCASGTDLACKVSVPDDNVESGAFKSTITLQAETGLSAALISVKKSGTLQTTTITNKD